MASDTFVPENPDRASVCESYFEESVQYQTMDDHTEPQHLSDATRDLFL